MNLMKIVGKINSPMVFLFLSLVIVGGGLIGLVISHEDAHMAINEKHGVASYVEYDFFNFKNPAMTIPLGPCQYQCDQMRLAHSINEVVGYQLISAFIGFSGLFIMGVFFLKYG